jgi:hypothetical protein
MSLKRKTKDLCSSVYSNLKPETSPTLLAFLSDPSLLKSLKKITDAPATVYDKAMDSEYLSKISGGGNNHRLFDNGHSLFDAWDAVKGAKTDDSLLQEITGYASAIWKDVTTPKGLPFTTLDKANYEQWAKSINDLNIPGVDKEYLYDLTSFDALEILGTSIGVVGAALALKKEDSKKLSEILGSMGIVSIMSANPLMGICTVATTAYAYKKKKQKIDKTSFIKSGAASGAAALLVGALGAPFLIELILAAVVVKTIKSEASNPKNILALIKKHIKHSQNKTSGVNQALSKVLKAS